MTSAFAVFLSIITQALTLQPAAEMDWIRISEDKRSFVFAKSGQRFVPWGFNYDRDHRSRLLEDYWIDEWAKVEKDFAAMKKLGANVVRIHLQLGRFMERADKPNNKALEQLARLVVRFANPAR
jgi:beta-glucosidase/6-phospho-beta-glucosidase/beta-galactosidase